MSKISIESYSHHDDTYFVGIASESGSYWCEWVNSGLLWAILGFKGSVGQVLLKEFEINAKEV